MSDDTNDIQNRLTAALAEKYAVERKLGEGGMALVYLATDIKHGRKVAVKVLRPELAASLGTERFLREIQLTAGLSHPHILPLYDSGEADGFLFYVMPFVEGESLDAMLKRDQQMSIPDAVRITREVAEALAVAHSRGLVHRDIKPDNIMMTGGHAVVADFGIARAVEEAGGDKLTQTGMAVGTPAYMSPEQAAGDPHVDGRSDVYSLGCVLYEMLVGDVPFTGPTPMAVMARHTMDHVTAPSIMRDTIPEDLEEIIYCAMAKTPADRFKTAGEMAEALAALETGGQLIRRTAAHPRQTMSHTRPTRAFGAQQPPLWRRALVPAGVVGVLAVGGLVGWQLWGSRSPAGPVGGGLDPRRIAVMYFQDLSPDSAWGFVADGLTEGLIDRLSAVPQFTVVSRNGVAPFRGNEVARDSVARALQVGSIITGTVEQEGNRLRVTTRLVEGESGVDIDRESIVLPSADLLVTMDSVSETVSRFLRQRLGEEIRVRERRTSTANVEAWALVQRAERARKDALESRAHGDSAAAMQRLVYGDSLLAVARQADPNWVEPVIQQGWIAYYRASFRKEQHEMVADLEQTITYMNEALALDPRAAEALHLRGRTRYRLFRERAGADDAAQAKLLADAKSDLETAVEIDPSLAEAWYVLSILSYDADDNFAAVRAAERAYEADAFMSSQDNSVYQLFQTYYDLEQFPKAQQWCREGARRFGDEPRYTTCQLMMMITPMSAPNVDGAWSLSRQLDSIAEPLEAHMGRMYVAGVLARAGLADSARHVLESSRAGRDIDPTQELAAHEAVMLVLLGDLDGATDLLTRYIVANPSHAFDLTSGDLHWWWRPLRDNPRFRALAAESH